MRRLISSSPQVNSTMPVADVYGCENCMNRHSRPIGDESPYLASSCPSLIGGNWPHHTFIAP